MSLPKYKDVLSLTSLVEIEKEIFMLQKSLFDLRRRNANSHGVKHPKTIHHVG